MTVFVVNKGCHDYSQAERYGPIVYLSDRSMNRFDLSAIWRKFEPPLAQSNKEDYILICGLSVMSVVATSIFVSRHGRLNLLLFKGNKGMKDGEYVEETIIFKEDYSGYSSKYSDVPTALSGLRNAVTGDKGGKR